MFATASLHYFGGGLMLDYCYFDQRPSLLLSVSGSLLSTFFSHFCFVLTFEPFFLFIIISFLSVIDLWFYLFY